MFIPLWLKINKSIVGPLSAIHSTFTRASMRHEKEKRDKLALSCDIQKWASFELSLILFLSTSLCIIIADSPCSWRLPVLPNFYIFFVSYSLFCTFLTSSITLAISVQVKSLLSAWCVSVLINYLVQFLKSNLFKHWKLCHLKTSLKNRKYVKLALTCHIKLSASHISVCTWAVNVISAWRRDFKISSLEYAT